METLQAVFDHWDSYLEPARLCQGFFILGAAAVLGVAATPPSARGLLTQYGARSSESPTHDRPRDNRTQGHFTKLISWATSVGQVPHSWFIHFYVLSVATSLFWMIQYYSNGTILTTIAEYQSARAHEPAMTIRQVQLTWLLMAMQGTRRLYECIYITRASSSTMWVVHWLIGCAYYLCMGVAVWVEGSDAILAHVGHPSGLSRPSMTEVVGVLLFLFAWSMQYRCHKHLSELKKYSLPQGGMFRQLICPHYTCECLLYLSLAIIAAPAGKLFNTTLLCGLVFVAANLGVTANGTRKWYAGKFGDRQIKDRWNMIPLIY